MILIETPDAWYCDVCGEPLGVAEGTLAYWSSPDGTCNRYFRIVHRGACFDRTRIINLGLPDPAQTSSAPLKDVSGPKVAAIVSLLTRLAGPRVRSGEQLVPVGAVGDWAHTLRRLLVPRYEAAYRHFEEAHADGLVDDPDRPVDPGMIDLILATYARRS